MSTEFNLVEYLKTELPALSFTVYGYASETDQDVIVINPTGGDPRHDTPRENLRFQIEGRNKSALRGKLALQSVYDLLKNRFGLVLPAVTVDGTLYPSVTAWQISPIQTVSYMGADQQGLILHVFNIILTIR